jgi:hydantoinase/oxoprolinase-like protein
MRREPQPVAQRRGRQDGRVPAASALDQDDIAGREILDLGGIEGDHLRTQRVPHWFSNESALAKIAPERVFACEVGGDTGISFGGYDEERWPFVFLEFLFGSWGGRPTKDGIDAAASAVEYVGIDGERGSGRRLGGRMTRSVPRRWGQTVASSQALSSQKVSSRTTS